MAIQGEHFRIDFSDDEGDTNPSKTDVLSVVGPIKERFSTAVPSAPKLPALQAGFPGHKKRFQSSIIRQGRSSLGSNNHNLPKSTTTESVTGKSALSDRAVVHQLQQKYGPAPEQEERQQIDAENRRKIAEMSAGDIEDARAELMANLNPALIEKLLKRSTVNDDALNPADNRRQYSGESATFTFTQSKGQRRSGRPELSDLPEPELIRPQSSIEPFPRDSNLARPSIHFPTPPRSTSEYVPLDPSSPDFLEDLHKHYFPNTPHDPGNLAWLNDPTDSEIATSAYHPSQSALPISQIRFSFRGTIIPPKESLNIPVTRGLHHHGLDPASAGYTIPELALLGRSTFPTQRCLSFQLLGRLLYRLGRGEFGAELTDGLWGVVEKERVVELLMQEASGRSGHKSAQTYATEALWLWRQGGGGDRGLRKIQEDNEETEERIDLGAQC